MSSEQRSWLRHRGLSGHLTRNSLDQWLPTIRQNHERLRQGVTGEPHEQDLERWSTLITTRDTNGMKRVMTGLDRQSIEMREVSPLGGLLSQDERRHILEGQSVAA